MPGSKVKGLVVFQSKSRRLPELVFAYQPGGSARWRAGCSCVPNESTEAWIRQEYSALVRTAIENLTLPIKHIRYEIEAAASRPY